ncbi:putative glyoxalase superfamily protein PhnB [Kribbella antiqua]|uniref:Putative glyoxalase superfamily protein PhnB n=1 Tax=Kribbella antiqua TaxID=2512217 RepID=A0A4R2IML6_9ACTN|nr:VOC family protein [Kribbella antiqua]TCO46284.1 putative glyoxalase superfamily protein PhnB [Kribbella antiqua]
MKFAKTVVYVEDAKASIEFFERAFGWKGTYWDQGAGEVEAGETKIAFANYAVGQSHLPEPHTVGKPGTVAFELSLVSDDVDGDFRRAVEAGAEPLKEPEKMPWGQVSSYLRCPDGTIIDLASPAGY